LGEVHIDWFQFLSHNVVRRLKGARREKFRPPE